MTVNVLVTGVGQTIGLGIVRALAISGLDCEIWLTDCNPLAVGLHMTGPDSRIPAGSGTQPPIMHSSLLPSISAGHRQYLQALAELCSQAKIDIILPGSEPELRVLCKAAAAFRRETGTFVMTGSARAVLRAMDKWQTYLLLTSRGFTVPRTILPTPANLRPFARECGFPLIIKPRRGSASQGLHLAESSEELAFYAFSRQDMLVQEYLPGEEYTAGIFLPRPGYSHGCIVLRRELAAGLTFRAEVSQADELKALSCAVAESSGLRGPCNVQLRKGPGGPAVLEINPRFSSSVSIRAHFGFNEPAMAIRHFILHQELPPPRMTNGIALRYWEEKYLPQE